MYPSLSPRLSHQSDETPHELTANWKAVVTRYPQFEEVWDDIMNYSYVVRIEVDH